MSTRSAAAQARTKEENTFLQNNQYYKEAILKYNEAIALDEDELLALQSPPVNLEAAFDFVKRGLVIYPHNADLEKLGREIQAIQRLTTAFTLRNYITYKKGSLFYFINAAQDYENFTRENPEMKRIIDNFGGLKSFCRVFPKYLQWKDRSQVPGHGLIFAVIRRTFDDMGSFPLISREREREMSRVALGMRDDFKQVYNFLARHTLKLSGLPANCYHVSYYTIRDALRELITDYHPDEHIRYAASNTNIEVFVKRSETFAEALIYFSIIMVDDFSGFTTQMFDHLKLYINTKQLSIGGYTLRIFNNGRMINNQPSNPYAPHFEAVNLIPEILENGANSGYSYNYYSDLINQQPQQIALPAISSTPPPPVPTSPPVAVQEAARIDSSNAVPATIGELPLGLRSPVIVDPARLVPFQQRLATMFNDLTNIVETQPFVCEIREENVFVFKRNESLRIGTGSEAIVYMGGHIEVTNAADTDLESIRRNFRTMAKPVAIKKYASLGGGGKLEIAAFRKLPRNADGIVNYIDHFYYEDDNYTVQELGLTTIHDLEGTLSFEEKMRTARAACLAMRELHLRPNGAIVHRDLRAPNVLITTTGALKICDFGISRVLPDNFGSIGLRGTAAKMFNCQPYEVQDAVKAIITNTERKSAEALPSIPVTMKGDIFMLGLFIFRLITGRDVLSNTDIELRNSPDLTPIESCCVSGPLLSHLLYWMLSHDRAQRPTIDDVLYHPFFRSWEENKSTVQVLYRELYNSKEPMMTANFKLLVESLMPLESTVNWDEYLELIPPNLRTWISGSRSAPQVRINEDTVSDHPLPNLTLCIQWIRHFFNRVLDPVTFTACYKELQDSVNGDEAVAGFLYAHRSVNWLLLGIWQMRIEYLRKIEFDRIAKRQEFEIKCQEYEQSKRDHDTKERRVKTALGQHNT